MTGISYNNTALCFLIDILRYGTTRQIQADRLLPSLGETVRSSVTLPACFGRPSGMSQASVESSALSVGIGASASISSSGSATTSSNAHGGRSDFLLARSVLLHNLNRHILFLVFRSSQVSITEQVGDFPLATCHLCMAAQSRHFHALKCLEIVDINGTRNITCRVLK